MIWRDKAMFIMFDYIVIAILACSLPLTTSNTIVKEAGVIGTLRASGYTRVEIVRHYMINPVIVTLISFYNRKCRGIYRYGKIYGINVL